MGGKRKNPFDELKENVRANVQGTIDTIGSYTSGGGGDINEQAAISGKKKSADYASRVASFKDSLLQANKAGTLSLQSYNEILGKVKDQGIDAPLNNRNAGSLDAIMNSFAEEVKGEAEGTTAKGKSRLGTQKMFDTLIDQPGRKQTLLTPRSNASKSILGV